jgi:hypothetical protein
MADIQKPDSPNQAGPNFPPPPLPIGWIAQWDPERRRYYYVQPSTAITTWEVPQHSAASTPAQSNPPYSPPQVGATYDPSGPYNAYSQQHQQQHQQHQQHVPEQTARAGGFGGLAGNLAQGLLSGGGKPGKHSSGGSSGTLGSLASGLLGGGGKHSSSSGGGSSSGGLLGTATSLLAGGKPGKHSSSSGNSGGSGGAVGGLMNLANNFMSGHSSSSVSSVLFLFSPSAYLFFSPWTT